MQLQCNQPQLNEWAGSMLAGCCFKQKDAHICCGSSHVQCGTHALMVRAPPPPRTPHPPHTPSFHHHICMEYANRSTPAGSFTVSDTGQMGPFVTVTALISSRQDTQRVTATSQGLNALGGTTGGKGILHHTAAALTQPHAVLPSMEPCLLQLVKLPGAAGQATRCRCRQLQQTNIHV